MNKALFFLVIVFCISPWGTPPIALALGILLALTLGNPFPSQSKKVSKVLLQAAVVLLGFSMDLPTVLRAGSQGILFAFAVILAVFLLGALIAKVLDIQRNVAALVSSGTAICGGSAIAAMASVIDAKEEEVSVAVGTVFLLNAVALYLFPVLGHALDLSQVQFGTWAGIAIHDVSSVVGAGSVYGKEALEVATAVKLSRVLYIVPIVLVAMAWMRRAQAADPATTTTARPTIPWFIGFFLLAAVVRSYIPGVAQMAPEIKTVAVHAFAVTLFLIGAGISRRTLKMVGVKPLIQGLVLWVFVSVASLLAIQAGL